MPVPTPAPRGFVIERAEGQRQRPGSLQINPRLSTWLSLAHSGQVQVFTGKVELGQGILSALRMIVAEELDLPLHAVRVQSASTTRGPDEGVTSGSLSIQDSGSALRHASAELRGLALQRAAQIGGVEVAEIEVLDGRLCARGQVLGDYWSLLADADLNTEHSGQWLPKPLAQRRLMGQPRGVRLDLPDKVYGRPRYIHDLQFPGLWHGRVLRRHPRPRRDRRGPLAAAGGALRAGPRAGVRADQLPDGHARHPAGRTGAGGRV